MSHTEKQRAAWTTAATIMALAWPTIVKQVMQTAVQYIDTAMVAVSEPFYGVSIIVEGMMMGVGKTKAPFLYNITRMWCVRILGTMICTCFLGVGLVSEWACMIAHNMLLFCLYLATFIRGSWNPLNTSIAD